MNVLFFPFLKHGDGAKTNKPKKPGRMTGTGKKVLSLSPVVVTP